MANNPSSTMPLTPHQAPCQFREIPYLLSSNEVSVGDEIRLIWLTEF